MFKGVAKSGNCYKIHSHTKQSVIVSKSGYIEVASLLLRNSKLLESRLWLWSYEFLYFQVFDCEWQKQHSVQDTKKVVVKKVIYQVVKESKAVAHRGVTTCS